MLMLVVEHVNRDRLIVVDHFSVILFVPRFRSIRRRAGHERAYALPADFAGAADLFAEQPAMKNHIAEYAHNNVICQNRMGLSSFLE